MNQWQLQDAKNRFSEVVARALTEGPQLVTRRGKDPVVVLSLEAFSRLEKPSIDLVTFLRSSPLADAALNEPEFVVMRDLAAPRNIDL